jgi:peptidoglycan-associated lipoprotein
MRRTSYSLLAIAIFASSLLITLTGCHKKVTAPPPAASAKVETPIPPPTPVAPAPTISLKVSPDAIDAGQSTTLSWTSSNATTVTIDNGVGTVESSGSRTISPTASTTYQARATGPGGNTVAQARVTVTVPQPAVNIPVTPTINDAAFFDQNIKDAFFDYDQYNIRSDAQAALQADARALNQRPNIRITIEGHCDERGSEKYNLALGDRRANAARDFLVGQGISAGRIDTISYGKEKNECEAHTEDCWQRNRRAHLVMR